MMGGVRRAVIARRKRTNSGDSTSQQLSPHSVEDRDRPSFDCDPYLHAHRHLSTYHDQNQQHDMVHPEQLEERAHRQISERHHRHSKSHNHHDGQNHHRESWEEQHQGQIERVGHHQDDATCAHDDTREAREQMVHLDRAEDNHWDKLKEPVNHDEIELRLSEDGDRSDGEHERSGPRDFAHAQLSEMSLLSDYVRAATCDERVDVTSTVVTRKTTPTLAHEGAAVEDEAAATAAVFVPAALNLTSSDDCRRPSAIAACAAAAITSLSAELTSPGSCHDSPVVPTRCAGSVDRQGCSQGENDDQNAARVASQESCLKDVLPNCFQNANERLSPEFRLSLNVLQRVSSCERLLQELTQHQRKQWLQLEPFRMRENRHEQACSLMEHVCEMITQVHGRLEEKFHKPENSDCDSEVVVEIETDATLSEPFMPRCSSSIEVAKRPRKAISCSGSVVCEDGNNQKPRLTPSSSLTTDLDTTVSHKKKSKRKPRSRKATDESDDAKLESVCGDSGEVSETEDNTKSTESTTNSLSDAPPRRQHRCDIGSSSFSDLDRGLPTDHPLRRFLKSNIFEYGCAVVIMCNAATVGYIVDAGINHAISHVGSPERDLEPWVQYLGYFYCAFYTAELILKLCVFGLSFWCGSEWRWNYFDAVLVLIGLYDFFMDTFVGSANTNLTWLRMIRFLKLVKMLRMVRVMRAFRVLRMMITSIAGSMMMLVWSVLMLFMVMYLFSLFFLMGLSSHLSVNGASSIDEETLFGVQTYWCSVLQSVCTLYMAVTGGADWEPLAAPVAELGAIYYVVFIFYIAFCAFAVLNVLTGMFVDKAMEISQNDGQSVVSEKMTRPETLAFRTYYTEIFAESELSDVMCGGPKLTWKMLKVHGFDDIVKQFFATAEITMKDACRIFQQMDSENLRVVDLEDFIRNCIHAQDNQQSELSMLLSTANETKRSVEDLAVLTDAIRRAHGLTRPERHASFGRGG
eukprot:TRINITY_DN42349_c0_g1_i1.p1 TRINITY_DN42349_c0_g1~~TRINITY_DN42349_c0_g1_i1.p1  ORF type:complete len:972 (-),score=118.09 TRINITY_DN42349_c0_g1_i1:19-2934(-)